MLTIWIASGGGGWKTETETKEFAATEENRGEEGGSGGGEAKIKHRSHWRSNKEETKTSWVLSIL